MKYKVQQTEFFAILGNFFAFHTPDNPENQNFEKLKKTPGDIIILHVCTINDNHMMYGSSTEPRVYLGIPFTCVTVNLD